MQGVSRVSVVVMVHVSAQRISAQVIAIVACSISRVALISRQLKDLPVASIVSDGMVFSNNEVIIPLAGLFQSYLLVQPLPHFACLRFPFQGLHGQTAHIPFQFLEGCLERNETRPHLIDKRCDARVAR